MRILAFLSGILVVTLNSYGADSLSLKDYLNQVKQKHLGFQASQLISEGAKEREGEASLLTSPNLIANLQYLDDQKPTNNPAFLGNRTVYQNYSLGVAQQTSFGLSAKLSYTVTRTELFGVNTAFVPLPKFYTASPTIELSQSLWRNGFGSETRAMKRIAEAQATMTELSERLKAKSVLAEAEGAYWRLAIAHQLVTVAKDGVERAKKIKDWSSRRASLSLADRSDVLQAEAGLQGKSLELQMNLDEEREAAKKFNSMIGANSEAADEKLDSIAPETLLNLTALERKGKREDVLAADEGRKAAQSASQIGREKNSPTVDLMSTYALNGRDNGLSPAMSQGSKTNQSTLAVGLKFTTPLDFGTVSADRAAYLKEEKGAELNYQRKLFEEEIEWQELTTRFNEAKRRLSLAKEIEKVQLDKLENEKKRLKTGRSVLYQVLLFEQDYANAQIMTLKTQLQILALLAQMKTYLPLGETL